MHACDNVPRLERVWAFRTGDSFRDRGRFAANRFVVAGQGELWDGGRLLEGDLTVTGSCSNGASAPGSFVLWRRP